MRTHRLDTDTAERLLTGTVHPDDAPPGFGPLATLLSTARTLPAGIDGAAATATVTAMVDVIRTDAAPALPTRRRMFGKLSTKAAVVFGTLALTASGAAAATGSLPDVVQDATAKAVAHLGIDLPNSDGNPSQADEHKKNGQDVADEHRKSGENPTDHDGTDADPNHGSVVSGVADSDVTDPHDGGKGEEVAPVASDGNSTAEHDSQGQAPTNPGEDHGINPNGMPEPSQAGEHRP
jgi:hypothetical protein